MDTHLIAHTLNVGGGILLVLLSIGFAKRFPTAFFWPWVMGTVLFGTLAGGELIATFWGRTTALTLIQLLGISGSTWCFVVTGRLLRGIMPLPRWSMGLMVGAAVFAVGVVLAGWPFRLAGIPVVALHTLSLMRLGWIFLRELPEADRAPSAAWVGASAIALGSWPWVFPYPLLVNTPYAWIGYAGAGVLQTGLSLGMMIYVADLSWARYKQAQEELGRVKNEFVSIVGHELRAPLTAVIGYAELLEEEELAGPLNGTQREYLAEIQQGGRRLQRLVDDLLDFSLAEHKALKLERLPVDLAGRVQAVAERMRLQADRAGVALAVSLPDGPVVALVDPDRVEQVLANLVGNALKFTPAGGRVTLALRAAEPASHGAPSAVIEVADTGVGIEQADLPRLFDKFFQSPGTGAVRARGGAGLGLAVAKGIVEAHGGTIAVRSQPGEGTVFTLRWPIGGVSSGVEPVSGSDVNDLTAT